MTRAEYTCEYTSTRVSNLLIYEDNNIGFKSVN